MRKNARNKHNRQHERVHEGHPVALRGRRNPKAAPNTLKFFAYVEGVEVAPSVIRGANGMKWMLP